MTFSQKETYKCVCGKEFEKVNNFNNHKNLCLTYLESVNKLHLLTCEYCGLILKSLGAAKTHKKKHEDPKSFKNCNYIKCEICDRKISEPMMLKHLLKHKDTPIDLYLQRKSLVCIFCGDVRKNLNSLRNHERLCKLNPNRLLPATLGKKRPDNKLRGAWNKGLTKETDRRIKEQVEKIKDGYRSGRLTPSGKGRKVEQSSIDKMLTTRANKGRITRYKYGTYNGIECDSGWELAFVLFCQLNNINIKRCKKSFSYFIDNKEHFYTPDFIIDTVYYEIKGAVDKSLLYKIQQFPKHLQLIVLYKKLMNIIIEQVIKVFGKEYTKLYDRKYPSWMDHN